MKHFHLLLLSLICSITVSAQNLLTPDWKFKTGDDLQWAQPATDDSGWKQIIAGMAWESQGFVGYDGFAWYRKKISIPANLKKVCELNGGMILTLGKIDDSDCIYFNGEKVLQTGDFPPTYRGEYDKERKVTIPVEKIKWGQENLIAVRVYDDGGNGGIYTSAISLKPAGVEDFVSILPAFSETNRIIITEGPINLPIQIKNNSPASISGKLKIQVKTDFHDPVTEKTLDVSVKTKNSKTVSVNLGSLEPGFYEGILSLEAVTANLSVRFNFGVNPEKIISPSDRQADFTNYWDRAKKELAAVDPQFTLIRLDSLCTDRKEWFVVEMRSLGNVLVRGFYGKPVKPGKYPAILHVQGYSSTMSPPSAYQGDDMVSFALNIRGHGNSKDNINPGFKHPAYILNQIHDKEMYIYRGAYMDCRRALDFLWSRSEVDTTRVAVEGGSQGGALSFATAALNPERIKVAVPAVPFLSDFRDYVRCANWPGNEFSMYVKDHPEIGWENVFTTLSYIDIKNLAPWIQCPLLMGVGLMDEVCPPHINFAAYNQLKTEKKYIVYPDAGHGLPSVFHEEKMKFIREKLGMKP